MQRSQPENVGPQSPQPRGLELQTDDEQQQDDAELGKVQDPVHIAEQAQPERSDHGTGGQIAQHRSQTQPVEDRNGDDGRTKEDGGRQQKRIGRDFGCHCPLLQMVPPVGGYGTTLAPAGASLNCMMA